MGATFQIEANRNRQSPAVAPQRDDADRRLAEILQGMTEACFALDSDWRFTFVNDRCVSLFHHSKEEMLGRKIWQVFGQLVGTPMEAHYRRAMAERIPLSFEALSPVVGRYLDIRLFPTPDGLAAFLLDIHSRKQAEEQLRIKQEHSLSLLRLARRLEREIGIEDVLRAAREELQATLGLKAVWFYLFSDDRRFLRLIKTGTRPPLREALADTPQELSVEGDQLIQEIAGAEGLVIVEDARTDPRTNKALVNALGCRSLFNVPVALSGNRLGVIGAGTFGDEGVSVLSAEEREFFSALASHVATVLDRVQAVEDRRRIEESLRQSEERFRQLAENIQEVFWVVDASTHQMLYISPGYEAIWGRTCASLYARPQTWLDAIHHWRGASHMI